MSGRGLVIGNWKMNGSKAENESLLSGLLAETWSAEDVQVGVAVPSIYLAQVSQLLNGASVQYGAQDVSAHASGAFTGEISALMLKEFNVGFTLVGHSERRTYHHETDNTVLEKTKQALAHGIRPVICVGETLQQYEAQETESVISRQLHPLCDALTASEWANVVIAYEPVWAIGTGKVATPDYAQKIHKYIRDTIRNVAFETANGLKILYGGSVKSENAAQLRAMPDIDGALVGGASLKAEEFVKICRNFR
ncbi:triose-phosphate isomerase [Leeia oryzae]|uniref:triose-phosphate isomerase n=1 Tax=Leeia oryzae TaxID=356662 RepID=UPI0003615E9A|nr:triose-phosphate isomerase [Leeia oryzae]